jgi:hypothetical protein
MLSHVFDLRLHALRIHSEQSLVSNSRLLEQHFCWLSYRAEEFKRKDRERPHGEFGGTLCSQHDDGD